MCQCFLFSFKVFLGIQWCFVSIPGCTSLLFCTRKENKLRFSVCTWRWLDCEVSIMMYYNITNRQLTLSCRSRFWSGLHSGSIWGSFVSSCAASAQKYFLARRVQVLHTVSHAGYSQLRPVCKQHAKINAFSVGLVKCWTHTHTPSVVINGHPFCSSIVPLLSSCIHFHNNPELLWRTIGFKILLVPEIFIKCCHGNWFHFQ